MRNKVRIDRRMCDAVENQKNQYIRLFYEVNGVHISEQKKFAFSAGMLHNNRERKTDCSFSIQ